MLVDGMEKQELKLREYQDELVKPALEGMNTIICAPTGSGKTFVAMEAIKHHVTKRDPKYVVFIVNTVSLVEQQETRLQQYLPEPVEVSSVCGSNPDVSLLSVLKENDVVVVTAQVLLNALKKKPASEGVPNEKHVSISQFSLLVFDECHHTTKEHPYNEIMRWYMTEKYEACTSMYLFLCFCLGCSVLIKFLCFKHASSSDLWSLIVNSLMFSLLLLALVADVVVIVIVIVIICGCLLL